LYSVAYNGDVLQITVSPPSATVLGSIGANGLSGLAYSAGRLYAIDETLNTLSTIDLSPLAQTTVGTIRVAPVAGPVLEVDGGAPVQDAHGDWFLWTNTPQALYRLDVTTAVATPVDPQASGLGPKTGLAVDYHLGNAILASSRALDALQTLDPATGQV